MGINRHSTRESVKKGEASWLALTETGIAMTFTWYMTYHHETLFFIAVSMGIAPFLLLRTEESVELGLKWFEYIHNHPIQSLVMLIDSPLIKKSSLIFYIPALLIIVIAMSIVAISAFIIRIVATIVTLIIHPIKSLKAIPDNWYRFSFSMDSSIPPELIPGIDDKATSADAFSFPKYFKFITSDGGVLRFDNLGILLSTSPLILFGYLPAIAYRLSLKSTTLIYIPLIWKVKGTFLAFEKLDTWLEYIKDSVWEKTVRWYSLALFAFFLLQLIASMCIANLNQLLFDYMGESLVTILGVYIYVANFELWHGVALFNATITLAMFYYGDGLKLKIKDGQAVSEEATMNLISSVFFIRGMLGLYTVACEFYIVYTNRYLIKIPPFVIKVLPFDILPYIQPPAF